MGQTVIAFPTIGVLENDLGQVGLLWFQSLTISFLSIFFHLIMCLSVCKSVCLFAYRSVYSAKKRQNNTKTGQEQDKTRQSKENIRQRSRDQNWSKVHIKGKRILSLSHNWRPFFNKLPPAQKGGEIGPLSLFLSLMGHDEAFKEGRTAHHQQQPFIWQTN